MRFQKRDGEILLALYDYGGLLSRRHLQEMFWLDRTLRAMQKRLSKLHMNGYIARPSKEDWRTKPIPESVYWLDWRGIIWVAGQCGIQIQEPSKNSENQLRNLAKQLRKNDIYWLREPRWHQLSHDLACVDSRLKLEKDVARIPNFTFEEWLEESHFRRSPDVIEYEVTASKGKTVKKKKGIIPDGLAVLVNESQLRQNQPARMRLLVEIDGSTHSNPRFGREKVLAGHAYIKSHAYKTRFGGNSGRWIILTGGERRMRNLMHQTKVVTKGETAESFIFTTMNNFFTAKNVLRDAIWWQVDREEPVSLLSPN